LIRALVVFWIVITSGTNLHNFVANRVLRAEILFFDQNPVGRIVTRFSKDIAVIDFVLSPFCIFIAQGIFRTITVCITVGIINPWLFIGIVICIAFMWLVLSKGRDPMQQSQKLDGILRGPIHSTFAFVIQGLVTLRAFDRVGYFKQDFNNTLEKCANATFVFNSTNRWVGLRLDMICVVFSVATIAIGFA
jgi:ABC-type bacteriocin/lantibiotic exporter with double-glycine peptidase domain